MSTQYPILIVIIPLLSALVLTIVSRFNTQWNWSITVAAMGGSLYAALKTMQQVLEHGHVEYYLGGWQPPMGIHYWVDSLNGWVLMAVTGVAFLTAIYAKHGVEKELKGQGTYFYILFLLFVTGLLGITITGDAFNLYVLLEVVALTSYGLMALGGGRAYLSTFNYLIMGTIGACFYLLGVGYLFIKTGTLNMPDLFQRLALIHGSQAVLVGFIFIMVGLWIKMAFFPFQGVLPNAYTDAPMATSCIVAPLITKVSVYVMIRMIISVFSVQYLITVIPWHEIVVAVSSIAIIVGSIYALMQTNLKRMLAYIVVAEVGYMVGGVWIGNASGLQGAIYHIGSDAAMTACMFMAVGCIVYKTGSEKIQDMTGIFKKMPVTMIGFLIGAFSLIGVPPTCGFFSKWYLILGGWQSGNFVFIAALLFSSLINAIIFFRIIEVGFFGNLDAGDPHHDDKEDKKIVRNEAPWSMLIPVLLSAVIVIGIGLYTSQIMTHIIQYIIPKGLG